MILVLAGLLAHAVERSRRLSRLASKLFTLLVIVGHGVQRILQLQT
jgi:hypothetical protein